ncbi:MAG TPA: trypsin-like serine protease [Streptosporangiaceae bacterium]
MRCRIAAAAVLVAAAVAGCSSSPAAPAAPAAPAGPAGPAAPDGLGGRAGATPYWTRQRLLGAQGWSHRRTLPSPGSTPSPRGNAHSPRVGALFDSDSSGDHFCTASVVDSPGGNVLITAAHCVNSGSGGANRANVEFIPDYADGNSSDGVWTPERYVLSPRWVNGADPDFDVAFIVLKPLNGKNIQDVLGANTIVFNAGYKHLVRVTGYPSTADAPISCLSWTSEQSQTQLKFNCQDFTGGTSGSPWLTRFDPITRTGAIVGVIGGYQQGGDTPAVSYSVYLNDGIQKLYAEATTGS